MSEALGISFEEHDRAGIITLNRPSRLNALTREMFEALSEHYRRWAPAPHIYGVLMQSSHPSVFSSGGDLKTLHEWSEQGAHEAIRAFYRAAYTHCWVLEKFIRPNVPLINGLVLGGGIGITLHGTHCVAGEGYRLAMPQVGIGFIPDIGGTYFLSHLLSNVGLYLALTGQSIGPAEAYRLGLVSHFIPSGHFHVVKDALADNHPIDRLLDGLHRDPGEGELVRLTPALDRIFKSASVEEILARLDAEQGEFASWAHADGGRDAQEVAHLAQSRLRPDATRQDPRPRRRLAPRISPRLAHHRHPRLSAKASPPGSPARGGRPAGSRPGSKKWTMPGSRVCSRRRSPTSSSSTKKPLV